MFKPRATLLLDGFERAAAATSTQLSLQLPQSANGALDAPERLVKAVLPRLDLLLGMGLGVNFNAFRTQRSQTVEVAAVVGDLLVGVILASHTAVVRSFDHLEVALL